LPQLTPSPLSRKPPALLNLPLVRKQGIPVIKRFSGGGTVVVDDDTLFATLLMRQDDLPDVRPYPQDIMSFMETFYQDVFTDVGSEGFRLKENGEPVCQKHCRPGSFSAEGSGRHMRYQIFRTLCWPSDPAIGTSKGSMETFHDTGFPDPDYEGLRL
jgi:hypothetical protein